MSLELAPLSAEELEQRDSSQVQGAADIFLHEELKIPYYFGIERLCVLATNNVEELLSLSAGLYDGLKAKQILRRAELLLSPQEQEKLLRDVAKRKRDFIPKNHTEEPELNVCWMQLVRIVETEHSYRMHHMLRASPEYAYRKQSPLSLIPVT